MKFTRWLRFALAFAAIAAVYFHRLDQPLLWDDEADTGVNARNILHGVLPSAFDGRNVVYFNDGAQLNRSLLSKQIPWVQYYLGALSLAVFGNGTAGLRTLFALAGLLAFLPLRAVLARRVKWPELVAALVLLAPQTVLFQRSARYYPILILLYACLLWHLSRDFKSGRMRLASGTLIFALFFHTHPFAAACAAAALLLFCLAWRRPALPVYLAASVLGLGSWLAWYWLLGPPLVAKPLPAEHLLLTDFTAWCGVFFRDFLATLSDLDVVDSLPLLFLAGVVLFLLCRDRRRLAGLCRDPLFGFVLLAILVQAAATAAVFGTDAVPRFAIIRYMPHLAVFALAACFVAADAAIASAPAFFAVCACAVAFNFTTLSHWTKPPFRNVPVSWVAPVYAEIFHPPPDAWDNVIAALRDRAGGAPGGTSVVFAIPEWTQAMMVFYIGDDYIVPPDSAIRTARGWAVQGPDTYLRHVLGDEAYRRLATRPEWTVDSIREFDQAPSGFAPTAIFPSYRKNPHDGTRPELTRHTFTQAEPVADIALYHWRG